MPVYTKAPDGLRMVNGMYSMNTRRGISMRMIGMQQVQANLSKTANKTYYASMAALLKIGTYIEEDMHKTPPTIPIDTGAMAARYRTVPKPNADPSKNAVLLGWANTAKDEYAPYVHEMTQPPYEKPINWSTPGSGAKFFEMAIKRNQKVMVDIVKAEIRKSLGL